MVILSELLSEGSSSSSSTSGHSSSTDGLRYDVFLSFRDVDTRQSFTDHLHQALIEANISTFLYDEEIEIGEDLEPELESAIKASRASIIVMSKNYAFSTWCLDELVLILEQCITSNHIVIPIFYHVEPTHVRKQQSSFGDAMAKHKKTMEAEQNAHKKIQWAQKMDLWNKALIEVANLKGKDVNGRLETEFIEEIVKDIHRRLHVPLRSTQPLFIGMDYHINFVTSWLKDGSTHMVDVLTISGMGGIGKTYLAKHIYGLYSHEFHKSSYIEDISKVCDGKFNGLLDLQEQLCNDISKTSSIKVHVASVYTSKIESAVARKRVFLVLDDISTRDQLDALLGSKGFHPGSKIIITTKDKRLTKSCALFKTNIEPKHKKLLLQGLNETESWKLLCLHAFKCNYPKKGYKEVSYNLVKYCQGHPLALELLGKSLYDRDVTYWEGCIEGLKTETDSHVNNVLRMSFNSLPSKNDKDLFKYIACFFVRVDKDVAETILKACNINIRSGIPNLLDRFLLSIGGKNELKMHQLVQEMGRFEVRQESPEKPWKRSLLWCHEESFRVLKQKKGKENILGLALDMRMIEKEKLNASYELKTDRLSNMDCLMLLQLNYVNMNGPYENFPEELRCLCMHGFHLKSIPSELPMENLVALDMSYSNIESFIGCYSNPQRLEKRQKLDGLCLKNKRLLGSLKVLNLSFCKQLFSLGDFDQLPALEKLILRNCTGLLEVCESIEQCVELSLIDLSYCNQLKNLPRIIGMLKKVKTMLLDGCNLGESQTENTNLDINSLEMCNANKIISISTTTSSSASMGAIPSHLKFFSSSLLRSLVRLSLANNKLSTEAFPTDFNCLSLLKELYLDNNLIHSMPNCVRTLPRIEILSMENCKKLKIVEHPPRTLRAMRLYSRHKSLEKVVFDPQMSSLWLEYILRHPPYGSYEIEGMLKIQAMMGVEGKVLRSLGWNKLDFLNNRHVGTNSWEYEIQMFYEFGIFSTVYKAEEMPSWFIYRSLGPSISFIIPSSSSPNNLLTGLNFCSLQTTRVLDEWPTNLFDGHFPLTPVITISNITKNRMWIYERYLDRCTAGGKYCSVVLCHWMFGMNELEGGDHITITVTLPFHQVVKECGVSLVYNDEEEGEEDALGYYKSWNHIIGGDLSPFQTTTGQYILNNDRFFTYSIRLFPYHRKFIPEGPSYQEKERNMV
ncbi:disease resistance protein RUN1 isoform X2 [Lactuca sativa]|uniref:disease resistance protein RUN1 isoform X2 n=1 Tax=Lactuca sativa TaxID=4236 RepID=UPI000CD8F986|nr:disease resistance protein RUN1 isoform X2 [Lactuca sativa]